MAFPLVAQPKKRPALLDKRDRQRDLETVDREQRAICKARSGGRCEVIEVVQASAFKGCPPLLDVRCRRRASENHHLRFGIGVRNRGTSALAEYRLEVCHMCHTEITNHVLRPVGPQDAKHVKYERIR